MKKIALLFYYLLAQNLPSSFIPGGRIFNSIRIGTLRMVFSVGKGCKIQKKVYFGSGREVSIGNYCQINENVRLINVKIGDFVMIAPGVTILGRMHNHENRDIPMILQGQKETKQGIIENDVWIGTNAIIMPSVKICGGCIIAAGAVVTRDCEPYGVYAGVPAKRIKSR